MAMRSVVRWLACGVLLSAAAAHSAAPERSAASPGGASPIVVPPPAGHYDGTLCVVVSAQAAQCGPVTADIGDAGQALVRVSDIAYRLELYDDRLGVTLFHGTMQIDGFFASYQWLGKHLQFIDTEKNTRYELKLGTRRFDAQ